MNFDDPQMMGLLALGSGLLKSSGPSTVPVGLGSAIGEAGQGGILAMQNAQKMKMAQDYQKAQMEHIAMQNALLKAQSDRETQKQAALSRVSGILGGLYNSAGQEALTQGAAQGDVGPTVSNAERMGGIMGIPKNQNRALDVFDQLSLSGIDPKSLIETFKLRNPEMKVEGGYAYNPRTVSPGFLPQIRVTNSGQGIGVTPSPSGGLPTVGALPGSVGAYGEFQRAGEGAKAEYDLVDVPMPNGGTQRMTRADAVRRLNPGRMDGTAPDDATAIRMVRDAESRGQPASITAPRPVGYQPSEAQRAGEKAAAEFTGKAEAQKVQDKPIATSSFKTSVSGLDRLIQEADAIKKSPGLRGVTGVMGVLPDVPGTAAADARARILTLQSQIGFNVLQAMRDSSKTGGALGAISEKEMELLTNNLASLKPNQSIVQMRQNLDQIIKYAEGAKQRISDAYQEQYGGVTSAAPISNPLVIDFGSLK